MRWIDINGHMYNAHHLQEFYWQNGVLFLYFQGRSVPDFVQDPDGKGFQVLRSTVVDWTKGSW